MTIADDLRLRTLAFATAIVRFCQHLPENWQTRELGRQLLRSGTSVAANYRAACRGRSRREFIARLGVAVEEADETVFWLELIEATGSGPATQFDSIRREAHALLAILARSHKTARENLAKE